MSKTRALMACLLGCGGGTAQPVTIVAPPPAPPACVDPHGATYPWRYRALTPAELDTGKATFTARNPGAWSTVTLRSDGLVFHLESTDPAIVMSDPDHPNDFTEADLGRWSAFLRANADFFGIADPDSAKLIRSALGAQPTPNIAELQQYIGATFYASVTVAKRPPPAPPPAWQQQFGKTPPPAPPPAIVIDGTLEPIAACPHITDDALVARLAGKRYFEKSAWFQSPPLDCGMGVPHPLPKGACEASLLGEATAERSVERASVSVVHTFVAVPLGNAWFEKRHVACVGLNLPAVKPAGLLDDASTSSHSTLTPLGKAPPLPLAVDLVTGEAVDAKVCPSVRQR